MLRRLQIVASAEQLLLERCRGPETDVAVLFGRNLRIARETSVRNDHAMGQSIAVSARPTGVQEVEDVLIADSPGLTELALDRNPAIELADLVLGGDDVDFLAAITDIMRDRISCQQKVRRPKVPQ